MKPSIGQYWFYWNFKQKVYFTILDIEKDFITVKYGNNLRSTMSLDWFEYHCENEKLVKFNTDMKELLSFEEQKK